MYYVSRMQQPQWMEGSLGGIITPAELEVFHDLLIDCASHFDGAFAVLLDTSKARLDSASADKMAEMRDALHRAGASSILNVVASETEVTLSTADRLSQVQSGSESYVLDATHEHFVAHVERMERQNSTAQPAETVQQTVSTKAA